MRAFAVGHRREMAKTAVEGRGASIALACRAFGVSETCYRYGPKLRAGQRGIGGIIPAMKLKMAAQGLRMHHVKKGEITAAAGLDLRKNAPENTPRLPRPGGGLGRK